jgi:hypothetical protein
VIGALPGVAASGLSSLSRRTEGLSYSEVRVAWRTLIEERVIGTPVNDRGERSQDHE